MKFGGVKVENNYKTSSTEKQERIHQKYLAEFVS